jgi:hypothetical protein
MKPSDTRSGPSIRYRPIYGGPFGKDGRFVLATMPCIERGLHSVRFMVTQPHTGAVLAVATDKQEALASARRLLRVTETLTKREAANDCQMEQTPLWADEQLPPMSTAGAKSKAVPRRRREVFDRSDGKCFYCGAVLSLTGSWHIEHQMPRALMGPDELPNLVAACVPCNLAKSDRTALEFITQRDLGTGSA